MCLVYLIRVQCNRRELAQKADYKDRSAIKILSTCVLPVTFTFSSETKKLMGRSFRASPPKNDRRDAANAGKSRMRRGAISTKSLSVHSSLSPAVTFRDHAWISPIWTASPGRQNTPAGRTGGPKRRRRYVNREWRLNANAAAGWNMRLHLDEKTCDDER